MLLRSSCSCELFLQAYENNFNITHLRPPRFIIIVISNITRYGKYIKKTYPH